jgi:hypothetical protein
LAAFKPAKLGKQNSDLFQLRQAAQHTYAAMDQRVLLISIHKYKLVLIVIDTFDSHADGFDPGVDF